MTELPTFETPSFTNVSLYFGRGQELVLLSGPLICGRQRPLVVVVALMRFVWRLVVIFLPCGAIVAVAILLAVGWWMDGRSYAWLLHHFPENSPGVELHGLL